MNLQNGGNMLLIKSFLIIIIAFLSFNLNFSKSQDSSINQITHYAAVNENWRLEYIEGAWWWVLYDIDGTIISKIPYDF